MRVRLAAEAAAGVRRWAEAAYPDEGCGVLIGTNGGGEITVTHATRGRNIVHERRHDRYELDPGDIVAAERRARAGGADVVGFWHSHPDHPARPSRLDSARAWPDYVYLICAVADGAAHEVAAFSAEEGAGAELLAQDMVAATGEDA